MIIAFGNFRRFGYLQPLRFFNTIGAPVGLYSTLFEHPIANPIREWKWPLSFQPSPVFRFALTHCLPL